MIMAPEFQFYKFPQPSEKKEELEEPTVSETDQSMMRQVDRGYRAFWARRGRKPPSVSSHYIMSLEELD